MREQTREHAVISATLAAGVVTLKSRSCLRDKLILIHAERTRITGCFRRTLVKLTPDPDGTASCISLIKNHDYEAGEARNKRMSVKDEMEIEMSRESRNGYD